MKTVISAIILGLAVTSTPAHAQSAGESEYMNSCAACHGPDGTGGGPMAGYLTGALPDLTQLSASNDGVFPVTKVYATIDGTMEAGPHGSREMPVWGNRYKTRGMDSANPDFRAEEADVYARFRILALTEYLAGLQN